MMSIIKSILAVIVGYLIFAVPAFAFFLISGQPPHASAPLSIMIESTAVGMLFALCGGYVAGWIAGRRPVTHGMAVATLLVLGAAVSLLGTLGKGAIWSQMTALIFMTPCAAIGGWLRMKYIANT